MKKLAFAFLSVFAFTSLAGCEAAPTTSTINSKAVEANQTRLQKAQPAPTLDVSLERANLVDRLKRLNAQNMSGYIYLLSYGQVVASYPVKGKATSLNAYLMAQNAIQNVSQYTGERSYQPVEQPDYDGAYGKNSDGIFFFTADTNTYVEWSGEYLFSDAPLSVSVQPQLVRQVK